MMEGYSFVTESERGGHTYALWRSQADPSVTEATRDGGDPRPCPVAQWPEAEALWQ
jgi:hypothetical protein